MTDEMITVNTTLVDINGLGSYIISIRFLNPLDGKKHLIILTGISRENIEIGKKHLEITSSKGRTSFIGCYKDKRIEKEGARKIWNQIVNGLGEYIDEKYGVTSY